jgi:hypothetical protein
VIGERLRDLVVGVLEAVGGMHFGDGAMRHLPAALGEAFNDVAAFVVVDQVVEVDLEPQLAHPIVVAAPARVGENRCIRDELRGQLTLRRTERGDAAEQRVLGFGRQIDRQTFGAPYSKMN